MEISLIASFLKMIFALAVVLGLLIGAMYFVRMFMQQTGPVSDNQALIKVISSKYLGPKNRIILIEVLEQVLVVGISNQQMTTLAQIDDPLAVAKIKTGINNPPIADYPGSKLAKYVAQLSLASIKQKGKAGK